MNIKNLFLFACLLAASLLGANNAPSPVTSPAPASFDGGLCNLPAPFFFQIEEVGTTWAKYAWGGSPLYEYRIRTYRASDNALLKTTNVPPGNLTAVVDGLPSGTEIYGIINAVCSDGSDSPNETQSVPRHTLIVELLVIGFTPDENVDCTIVTSPYLCEFSNILNEVTTFKITRTRPPYSSRIFGMTYTGSSSPQFEAHLLASNGSDNSLFDFTCQSGNGPDCEGPDEGQIWYIYEYPPVKIATFTPVLNTVDTKTYLKVTQLSLGYKIESYEIPEFRPSDPVKGQTITFSPTSGIATASPNPFSEALEVFPDNLTAEYITLQLFNLSGQKVLDQQFTGGQEQYSLPTAGLSPGFYMLRIEADGAVQTLKVVKSE